MDKYKLVIENPTDAYILNTGENKIVALCSTKRPDLKFSELQKLVDNANENLKNKESDKGRQEFQLGDIAYMIDDDYNYFQGVICKIELNDGRYYYTTNSCDFENKDIGDWVFKSKLKRDLHIETLIF